MFVLRFIYFFSLCFFLLRIELNLHFVCLCDYFIPRKTHFKLES